MTQIIKEYLEMISDIPDFLYKYLPLLETLKGKGYFCGMDYASKDVYHFKTYISRFDHSLSTALITWKYSKNKKATIAALFHDYATPCFSHVIDYMHGDYENQESTEEKWKELLRINYELRSLLKLDQLSIEDIDFKKYSIVDNHRPKMCADRIDGIILTSFAWTKELGMEEVPELLKSITVYQNEEKESELGFDSLEVAYKIINLNRQIERYCHSNFDNYMMSLLAYITKRAIEEQVISYNDLYQKNEKEILERIELSKHTEIKKSLRTFQTISHKDIPITKLPNVKNRVINPLVLGKRINIRN